jgi:hypothetical protein
MLLGKARREVVASSDLVPALPTHPLAIVRPISRKWLEICPRKVDLIFCLPSVCLGQSALWLTSALPYVQGSVPATRKRPEIRSTVLRLPVLIPRMVYRARWGCNEDPSFSAK